jgi:hypothetical protein
MPWMATLGADRKERTPVSLFSRVRTAIWLRLVALVALGIVANAWVELSIVAVLLILIITLSLPPLSRRARRITYAVVIASAVASGAGLLRFALTKAITGITEGGQRAASKSALWRLREVLLAEDALRKGALVDVDGDGIGEARLIDELAGVAGADRASLNLLNYQFKERVETPLGGAIRVASHLFIVCLPTTGGGWSAHASAAVDHESSERRFVAYAWPDDGAPDVNDVWFLDEHENILLLSQTTRRYHGRSHPPPCDAALGEAKGWTRWKDKQPRDRLPGDAP